MKGSWNTSFFIARTLHKNRLLAQQTTGQTSSNAANRGLGITKIATISIALAMIVNIVTVAVVDGFQQEVSRKVIGFGSHISIQKQGEASLMEASPLRVNEDFKQLLAGIPGVTSVQSVAYKPALLQSSKDAEQQEILGVNMKGVSEDYDWTFFKAYLKQGKLPNVSDPNSSDVLISKRVADDLHYRLNDTINAYFVKQQPVQRQFKIVGIYETGLEDFDKKLVFTSIRQVQDLNDWGIKAQIVVDDTLLNGDLIVRAQVSGGNGNYRFNWGKGFEKYSGFQYAPSKDSTIRLIVADYWSTMDEPTGSLDFHLGETTIPDTAELVLKRHGISGQVVTSDGQVQKDYLDEDGYHYRIPFSGGGFVEVESFPGKGSSDQYIGSYEVMVTDFGLLEELKRKVQKNVTFQPDFKQQVQVSSIKDNHKDLFVWLEFLDLNMAIVIFLMLLIGIINMGSALLVMILVRSNFIGVLKSLGATNKQIRRYFVLTMGQMVLRGMLIGNVIGFGLCVLQDTFQIMPLDPKVYYLNAVPVAYDWSLFAVLNIGTLVICLVSMIIPALLIARVSPVKAIRFS